MGNVPPYQPEPPFEEPSEQPGQQYEPERPHNAYLDQPPAYQPGQRQDYQGERAHDYQLDQPASYQPGQSPGAVPDQFSAQAGEQQQERRLHIRRRPCGVMLMSCFLLVQGLFLMLSGIFGILGVIVLVFDISRGSMLLIHGLIAFALGILSTILAFGMFMLTRWAFWAAVAVAFFNLLTSLTILVQTGFASFGHIFSGIFSLIVLFYFLFDPDARRAFTRDAPSLVEF